MQHDVIERFVCIGRVLLKGHAAERGLVGHAGAAVGRWKDEIPRDRSPERWKWAVRDWQVLFGIYVVSPAAGREDCLRFRDSVGGSLGVAGHR